MTASHDATDGERVELSKEANHLFSAIQVVTMCSGGGAPAQPLTLW